MKYIVVDLEMNNIRKRDPARKICVMEIIEIGAVMLDEEYKEIDSFRIYVKPEYNSVIMPGIVRLTGITYDMVEHAPAFADAMRQFAGWCLSRGEEIKIYAWSGTDYDQVAREMRLKNFIPDESTRAVTDIVWSDFQKTFDEHLGFDKQVSLSTALDMAAIEFRGKEHDALDDARNTAELFQVFNNPELFEATLEKIREIMNPKPLESSLGSMFDFSQFIITDN